MHPGVDEEGPREPVRHHWEIAMDKEKHLHAPVLRRVLHVLALHVPTATATTPGRRPRTPG